MALIRRVADKLTLRTADLSKAFFFFPTEDKVNYPRGTVTFSRTHDIASYFLVYFPSSSSNSLCFVSMYQYWDLIQNVQDRHRKFKALAVSY